MTINLAPYHKQGLSISNPVILGGGSIGYGEEIFPGIDVSSVGALVVGPVTRYSSGGSPSTRVAESGSSYVLNSGLQNRGVSGTIKKYEAIWSRLGCPIILQIADTQPDMLEEVVERVSDASYRGVPIAGLELLLSPAADESQTDLLVDTVIRSTDLPLLVNLPLNMATQLADAAVYAGADSLVVGQPPHGTLYRQPVSSTVATPVATASDTKAGNRDIGGDYALSGLLGGPALFPLMLHALGEIQAQKLECTLIARGGIHSAEQARQSLASGATAIQLGSVLWVEPGVVQQVVSGVSPR